MSPTVCLRHVCFSAHGHFACAPELVAIALCGLGLPASNPDFVPPVRLSFTLGRPVVMTMVRSIGKLVDERCLRGFITHAALSHSANAGRIQMQALHTGGITEGLLRELADTMDYSCSWQIPSFETAFRPKGFELDQKC